ncbi:hypothetical protein D9M72_477580 [compost metagenome]
MEAGCLVRAADTEVDADCLADLRRQGIFARKRVGGPVEDVVFRVFIEQPFDALRQLPLGAVWLRCVDLALHHVELAVDRRQTARRLDEDQAIHAVGDVMRGKRHGTVIYVQTRLQGLE